LIVQKPAALPRRSWKSPLAGRAIVAYNTDVLALRTRAVRRGDVYVLDGQTYNVCRFDPSGALVGEIATGIPNPMGPLVA